MTPGPIALAGNASTSGGVEQLRQAVDRHLPTAQRQRTAGHAAERLRRQRHPGRRGRDLHGRQRTCPSGSEAATTSGCVTADPLYDPTDFTPGGGDTGTVLISPLIKPGTVSSTYYNHYSTLRTLEDLLLTGQSCTEPSNADTPLAAGTVCGGLDGQGHIGYAAQAGLADFGPDVFTAQSFTPVPAPPGFPGGLRQRVERPVLPGARQPRPPGSERSAGGGGFGGSGGAAGAPAAEATAATAVTAATGPPRPATAETAATAATAPARPRSGSTESG